MTSTQKTAAASLSALTAGEVMSANLVSIRAAATVPEAIALLTERGFNAAPVIDEAGHPLGVVSRADILIHDRERILRTYAAPPEDGIPGEPPDLTTVDEIMTPAVFSVTPQTTLDKVVEQLVALNVHQLYVVDHDGFPIGVISALDVLRHLPRGPAA